jgi:hypothetical protein
MSIYKADSRCTHCKNWATVHLSALECPTTGTRFLFTCQCLRRVEGVNADFTKIPAMPPGGVIAVAIPG